MRDVIAELRHRIHQKGVITFAEFMEVALYWSRGGYYTSRTSVGAQGDFFTAPATHPLFGTLIALQLQQQWEALDRPAPFWVLELGSGNGQLGHDVLTSSPNLAPEFSATLRYAFVDRAAVPGVEGELPQPAQGHIHRVCASTLPLRQVVGCILANELLDALPVHRVTVQGGQLQEVYVTLDREESFQEVIGEPSTPALVKRFEELGVTLPEGYRTEVNLCLEPWLEEVAATLERGFLVLIDYGHPAERLYSAERHRGTLRCYYKHTLNANPYQHVGGQDIGVHVDFTTLVRKAESLGLKCLGDVSQREFLVNLGFHAFAKALGRLPLDRKQGDANRMAMLELIKPEGMGRFRVLAFAKGVEAPVLHGIAPDNALRSRLEAHPQVLTVPLATSRHMPLLQGTYPWMEIDWDEVWC